MIKKLSQVVSGLFNHSSTDIAYAGIEPLSPIDAKYIYPMKSIIVNGHKVAYIDEGKGQPIVFIHGLGATLADLDGLFPAMVKNGYRVIGIDLLGYGKSDKPNITYSIPFHAETLVSLVKQLGLKDTVLVGHSMGGAISNYSMLKEPALFRSMVLLTPGGFKEYSSATIIFVKMFYNYVWGNRYSDLDTARKCYRKAVYQWNTQMEEILKTKERMMLHPDWKKVQKTIKDSFISLLQTAKEILPKIGDIKKPVLVLLAANDNVVPTKKVKTNIEKNTSQWKIETYEKCGHVIQFDQKDKVIQRMLEFLRVFPLFLSTTAYFQ